MPSTLGLAAIAYHDSVSGRHGYGLFLASGWSSAIRADSSAKDVVRPAGIRVGPAMNVAYDAIFRTALPLHVPLLSVGISPNR